MSIPAIACRGLEKTYPGRPPVHAVRGVDLKVWQGECFGVLGPNGAGKTTTIEILEGLLPATAGEVEILGQQWSSCADAIRQRIGVSLQETRLSDRLTVFETLRLFRSFYPSGPRPKELIERVRLEEKTNALVKHLSGGQRQRLAVACALVGDPELLFLDEPTTGLDPTSRRDLWDLIRSFRQEGRTIMLTTHYMEEAHQLCDRVAIFDRGRIIAEGTADHLIASLGAHHVIEFSTAEHSKQPLVDHLRQLPSVHQVDHDNGTYRMTTSELHVVLPALIADLAAEGIEFATLMTRHASLEDVFLRLTGRQLADEEADDHTQR